MSNQSQFPNNYDEKNPLSKDHLNNIFNGIENDLDMMLNEEIQEIEARNTVEDTALPDFMKESDCSCESVGYEAKRPEENGYAPSQSYEDYKKGLSGETSSNTEEITVEMPEEIIDGLIELSLLLKTADFDDDEDEIFDLEEDFMEEIDMLMSQND